MHNARYRSMTRPFGIAVTLFLTTLMMQDTIGKRPLGYQALSDQEMGLIWGSGGCSNCRYAGARIDECYHEGQSDAFDPNACIANYSIEDSCDPATGTCAAVQRDEYSDAVQYYRSDSGCTTYNPCTWTVWLTHYYGASCATHQFQVRCQKTNGICDGTLIDSATTGPGIHCL